MGEGARKKIYTLIALMASLASLFSILKLTFPYPFLPYLKFDLAEIPAAFMLLLVGFEESIIVSVIHLLFLMMQGEFVPIGPLLKFMAVASMLAGYHLTEKLLSHNVKGGLKNTKIRLITALLTASATRIIVMLLANIVVLLFVFPQLVFTSLWLILLHTSIFNLLHTFFTMLVAYSIVCQVKSIIGIKPRTER
ncbi:MAG: hypothetical protein J7L38_01885 [Thermoproteales archaeon]|nr:hypothetical protein [Thermoproteales archaeon]